MADQYKQSDIDAAELIQQTFVLTYETNEKLTQIRAENMKYDLIGYFESKSELKGKVNVVIVTTVVQGPEYVKDAANKEKYFPYQYVGLKTE